MDLYSANLCKVKEQILTDTSSWSDTSPTSTKDLGVKIAELLFLCQVFRLNFIVKQIENDHSKPNVISRPLQYILLSCRWTFDFLVLCRNKDIGMTVVWFITFQYINIRVSKALITFEAQTSGCIVSGIFIYAYHRSISGQPIIFTTAK